MSDEIEVRKREARRGWIADLRPPVVVPLSSHHVTKWFTMMGARDLLRERDSRGGDDGR
jgi:hypothetical protein